MLTFLELYQTLLGFVFFKLYTDSGLVYPPPLDTKKDEGGAGVGAFSLQEAGRSATSATPATKDVEIDGKRVTSKDVRQTIKTISATSAPPQGDVDMPADETNTAEADEEFVPHPSASDSKTVASLPPPGEQPDPQ